MVRDKSTSSVQNCAGCFIAQLVVDIKDSWWQSAKGIAESVTLRMIPLVALVVAAVAFHTEHAFFCGLSI
jgi:hypothetical protein